MVVVAGGGAHHGQNSMEKSKTWEPGNQDTGFRSCIHGPPDLRYCLASVSPLEHEGVQHDDPSSPDAFRQVTIPLSPSFQLALSVVLRAYQPAVPLRQGGRDALLVLTGTAQLKSLHIA